MEIRIIRMRPVLALVHIYQPIIVQTITIILIHCDIKHTQPHLHQRKDIQPFNERKKMEINKN